MIICGDSSSERVNFVIKLIKSLSELSVNLSELSVDLSELSVHLSVDLSELSVDLSELSVHLSGELLNSIAFSQRRYVWKLCKFLGETVEILYHKISIWLWTDNNWVRHDGGGDGGESVESGVLFTFEGVSRVQFYHSLADNCQIWFAVSGLRTAAITW